MEDEAAYRGLPNPEIVEMQMRRRAKLVSLPVELLPPVGRCDPDKPHYVEIGEIYYHYVFQIKGQEASRRTTEVLDELLYWIFRDATFELATLRGMAEVPPGGDIRQPLYRIQKELMAAIKQQWADRLTGEIEEVLTRNPFKTKPSGHRHLSLRDWRPPGAEPADPKGQAT